MARKRKSTPLSDFPAARPFRPAALSLSTKTAAIQTESIQHGAIAPVSTYAARGCCTKPQKGPGVSGKTCNAPPRPGQVELLFPSASDSKKFKVKPGPALWFCTGYHKGVMVPVKDPRSAKKIAQEYVACVGDRKTKVKSCLSKLPKE